MRQSDSTLTQGAVQHVKSNVILSHPTITSLAAHLFHIIRSPQRSLPTSSAISDMRAMVERYTAWLPSRLSAKQSVLLTGSNGALGSYLLAQMLAEDRVEWVWAVNWHSKGESISERQRESFVGKALDVELLKLEEGKLVYVEAELSENILGLDKHLYQARSSSLPHETVLNFWN